MIQNTTQNVAQRHGTSFHIHPVCPGIDMPSLWQWHLPGGAGHVNINHLVAKESFLSSQNSHLVQWNHPAIFPRNLWGSTLLLCQLAFNCFELFHLETQSRGVVALLEAWETTEEHFHSDLGSSGSFSSYFDIPVLWPNLLILAS